MVLMEITQINKKCVWFVILTRLDRCTYDVCLKPATPWLIRVKLNIERHTKPATYYHHHEIIVYIRPISLALQVRLSYQFTTSTMKLALFVAAVAAQRYNNNNGNNNNNSQQGGYGSGYGDPHFMVKTPGQEQLCFDYSPATDTPIPLIADPVSALTVTATTFGKKEARTHMTEIEVHSNMLLNVLIYPFRSCHPVAPRSESAAMQSPQWPTLSWPTRTSCLHIHKPIWRARSSRRPRSSTTIARSRTDPLLRFALITAITRLLSPFMIRLVSRRRCVNSWN